MAEQAQETANKYLKEFGDDTDLWSNEAMKEIALIAYFFEFYLQFCRTNLALFLTCKPYFLSLRNGLDFYSRANSGH